MNRQLVNKIAVIVLAFIVTLGSVGLIFSTHYCRTNNTLEQSFLPFPITCEHTEMQARDVSNDTSNQADSCCSVKNKAKVKPEDCCKDETKYFKFASDIDAPQLQIKVVAKHLLQQSEVQLLLVCIQRNFLEY